MEERLTLDRAWELCIAQWDWIIRKLAEGFTDVCALKYKWLFQRGGEDVQNGCFFCEYNSQNNKKPISLPCKNCPGKTTRGEAAYWCEKKGFHWRRNPHKFYAKLLRLNKKRLKVKKKA